MILRQLINDTKKWVVTAMKIREWGFTSSLIRMATGWKSFQNTNTFYLMPKPLMEYHHQGFSFVLYFNFSLITNVNHSTLNRSYNNTDSIICCMDHLTISNINTTMILIYCNISRLWITYSWPSKKCIGCSKTAVRSCQAIGHKSRTIKCSRSACSPLILGFSNPTVSTVYNRISCGRIITWLLRRSRCWCCSGCGCGIGSGVGVGSGVG